MQYNDISTDLQIRQTFNKNLMKIEPWKSVYTFVCVIAIEIWFFIIKSIAIFFKYCQSYQVRKCIMIFSMLHRHKWCI